MVLGTSACKIYQALSVASVVHYFFCHTLAVNRGLKAFEWRSFMVDWAQRYSLQSKAFLSGWTYLVVNTYWRLRYILCSFLILSSEFVVCAKTEDLKSR